VWPGKIDQIINETHDEQLGHLDEGQLRRLITLLAAVRERT